MSINEQQAERLREPFPANAIEWRVGQAGVGKNGQPWVKPLAYLTSRAVMDRLDEVFRVGGWSHSIREIALGNAVGVICRLEAGGVHHDDVAECSDIEALKGAASGALKRAAVHFGVGRYLYDLPDEFARVHEGGQYRYSGKSRDGQTIQCRWDPPPLPAWALPRQKAPAAPAVPPVRHPPEMDNHRTGSGTDTYSDQDGADIPDAAHDEEQVEDLIVPDGLPEGYDIAGFKRLVYGRDTKKVQALRKLEQKKLAAWAKATGEERPASRPKATAVEIGSNILALVAELYMGGFQ